MTTSLNGPQGDNGLLSACGRPGDAGIAPAGRNLSTGAGCHRAASSAHELRDLMGALMAQRAADVIVIGGGVFGSATAWRLARAGFRVTLLEQFATGHALGSSHGPSRMIRLAYEEPEYIELGQEAFRLWRELEAESGEALLQMTGGLDVGTPDAYEMDGIVRTYETLKMPYERLDRDELRQRYPQLHFPEGTIGLHSPHYGILAASRCVAALAARAAQAGADLHQEERALEIVPEGEGVSVRTDKGVRRAGRAILAAGSWTNPLLAPLGLELPLTVLQEQLAFCRVREPELHGPDRLPLVINRFPGTTSIGSLFPIFDHEGVKVMVDRIGPVVDPASPDRGIDPVILERQRAYAVNLLPAATGEVLETTSCRYTMTPDEDFIIDLHPEFPQVVFASACSGHGFKFGPVIGQMLADLALTGETDYPTALFRLDRPALQKSWNREVESGVGGRESAKSQ
jgi:monomeric sarcosine oxidase